MTLDQFLSLWPLWALLALLVINLAWMTLNGILEARDRARDFTRKRKD